MSYGGLPRDYQMPTVDPDKEDETPEIEVKVENILHYLLDYERDVNIEMALASNRILPGRLTSDTVIVGLLGEELNRLHFKADASISNDELDAFLDHDTLPEFNFKLDSFGIGLGVYADISDVSASLTFDTDTLSLHYLNGNIGSSGFSFSGKVVNLEALMNSDSGEMVGFDYKLTSPMMKAEDLLIYKSRFLLPESYRTEYLEDFHLEGSAYFPVEGIVYDSVDQDFGVDITDMGWHFRYYPMAIDSFRIRAQKEGDKLLIDNLEGNIGESNLKLSALIGNYADSSLENLYGNLELHSDLLDFDKLLNYQLPIELKESPLPDSAVSLASAVSSESPVSIVSASSASSVSATSATSAVSLASAVSSDSEEPQRLDQMEFPNFNLNLDIGELRFSGNSFYDIKGAFRSSIDKIFYIDSLDVSGESGGGVELSGAFILTDPLYKLSMQMQMKEFNINDLNFAMGTGEETYSLKENFAGIVTGSGQAEVFLTPDLEPDMDSTTVLLQVDVKEGELVNFAPLKAAGKFLNNRDLDYVRYSTSLIRISFADSIITVPLTIVESTVGQILIEGEQRLDNSYLYLARVPPWLVKDAAKSMFSKSEDDGKEDEIREMKMGNFVVLTIWSNGEESGVVLKDQREKYR